jgi:hypothetical protein
MSVRTQHIAYPTSPYSYLIFAKRGVYKAKNGQTEEIEFEDDDPNTVISNVLNSALPNSKICFKGDFTLKNEMDMTKSLIVDAYSATFTWNGDTTAEHFMFKNSTTVDGFYWFGGKILSNSPNVYPFDLMLRNAKIKDVTVNHTIFARSTTNVKFENIYQLGQQGAPGHDFGINIVGGNVLVDGFYAPLATEYQGGFVINYIDGELNDKITLRHIYVKGKFGSFVHWYIPRSDTQKVFGQTIIEDFHVEVIGPIQWAHFGTFPLLDTEGSTGTYSGNFGTIIVRNGRIIGNGTLLVGTQNGLKHMSLYDFETGGLNGTVNFIAENVYIDGMKGWAVDADYLAYNIRGSLKLHNLTYKGSWAVKVEGFHDIEMTVEDSKFDVGANAIVFESANDGTTGKLNMYGNMFSNNPQIFAWTNNVILDYMGNDKPFTVGSGTPKYYKNGGIATFSGNGTQTQFTIAHGLAGTPKVAIVTPASNDAKGTFYITIDATNIYVNYATAPPAGTNNVVLMWRAEM